MSLRPTARRVLSGGSLRACWGPAYVLSLDPPPPPQVYGSSPRQEELGAAGPSALERCSAVGALRPVRVRVRGEGRGGGSCPQARGGWFRVFGVEVESFSSWASRAVRGKFCRVRGLPGRDGCQCRAGAAFLLPGRQRPEELPVQRRSVRTRRWACPSPSSMASPALPGLSTGPWKNPLYHASSAPPHPQQRPC